MSSPTEEEEVNNDHEYTTIMDAADYETNRLLHHSNSQSSDNDDTVDAAEVVPLPPFSWKKLWKFTGPGFLMSIAFLDPGSLEGDLQAGAIGGYSLLWLLMWTTGMGLLIQLLSARLGVVTGRHMAEICREEYPKWASLLLWAMSELALIAADIQEVIGSAIALKILTNGVLPLWAGVVITAADWLLRIVQMSAPTEEGNNDHDHTTITDTTSDHEAHRLLPSQSPPSDDDNDNDVENNGEQQKLTFESGGKILPVDIESRDDAGDDHSVVPPFSWKKLWKFTGPGFLMSIAFLDPGNIEGDLQAGAIAGYSLLWLLMWATIMGLLIQLLSARLGVVTGRHMAEICREEYPYWARIFLWAMSELALIAADIQAVIGSAIALKILTDGFLPLWAGVIITAADCFIFLFLENYGVRKLEAAFAVLITIMALSFAWMFADTKPSGKELLIGLLVPKLSSKTIQTAVGVVGCVITPHNVFLYSALVQSRKIDVNKKGQVQEALNYYTIESCIAVFVSFAINLFVTTVFAKGFYGTKEADGIGLVNAGQYLQDRYGGGFLPILYIWGIGLLAAGQSSTLTGTYAGQFIMGGFLNLRMRKWLRSLITRSFAIVPTIIVAVYFKRSEDLLDVLNEWLNVVQAMQIPFAVIPLLTLVSNEQLMGVFKIGPKMERVVWTVAALVIMINGYVIVEFFFRDVKGLLVSFAVCIGTAAYVSFIGYLISYGNGLAWFDEQWSKRFAYARS